MSIRHEKYYWFISLLFIFRIVYNNGTLFVNLFILNNCLFRVYHVLLHSRCRIVLRAPSIVHRSHIAQQIECGGVSHYLCFIVFYCKLHSWNPFVPYFPGFRKYSSSSYPCINPLLDTCPGHMPLPCNTTFPDLPPPGLNPRPALSITSPTNLAGGLSTGFFASGGHHSVAVLVNLPSVRLVKCPAYLYQQDKWL